MKKYLFLLAIILVMVGCKTKHAVKTKEVINDSDVLRPPEGYSNKVVQRAERFKDSVNETQNTAARSFPQPCIQVTGLVQTGVTANTASFAWTSTGVGKYYVYKNGSYVGTATTNSYKEQGLTPTTTYQFTVAGVGKGNKLCPVSAALSITTNTTPPDPGVDPGGGTAQVIFLQFDSCTVSGTNWGNVVSPGSGLTDDKRLEIFNYYKLIYAGHPKLSFTMDKKVFDAADPTHRQTTVFTTNSAWYGQVGGVSFIGSFNTNTVNWVFSELLNFSSLNCAVAGVHEDGHALGCYHAVDYCGQAYGGALLCSDGVYRAKIMGASYTNYEHYFQTPTRCATFGVPCLTSQGCIAPNEDQIIESHLK